MDNLFKSFEAANPTEPVSCKSPVFEQCAKAAPVFNTPSTLDFGSSAINVDTSTESVFHPADVVDPADHDDHNKYQSYFDQCGSSDLMTSSVSNDWSDLNKATEALLDPTILKMFVDSLTRSITEKEGSQAPSVVAPVSEDSLTVSDRGYSEYTPPRNIEYRRTGTNLSVFSNQSALDRADSTTVMLRNVPYDARQTGVLSLLEEEGFTFDFFYAPLDFKSRNNLGYAFINLTSSEVARDFFEAMDGKRITSRPGWEKPLRVCWARVQGLDANVDHYRNSPVNEMPVEFKPMIFDAMGQSLPFPEPDSMVPNQLNNLGRNLSTTSTVRPRERRLQQATNTRGFLTPVNGSSSLTSFMLTRTPQPNSSYKIFVGGLSPETCSETLEMYMSGFGRVVDCHVLIDTQTGRSRCYGFCSFADAESAQAALSYTKNHIIDGRGIVVRPYTSHIRTTDQ